MFLFFSEVSVHYKNGLPIVSVPLPSRQEQCLFTLKPVTNTLSDFIKYVQEEDKGVDRVAAYSTGRIFLGGLFYLCDVTFSTAIVQFLTGKLHY